ncbi:hypothetical protein Lal_00040937, partial [Lupinus albus]
FTASTFFHFISFLASNHIDGGTNWKEQIELQIVDNGPQNRTGSMYRMGYPLFKILQSPFCYINPLSITPFQMVYVFSYGEKGTEK